MNSAKLTAKRLKEAVHGAAKTQSKMPVNSFLNKTLSKSNLRMETFLLEADKSVPVIVVRIKQMVPKKTKNRKLSKLHLTRTPITTTI